MRGGRIWNLRSHWTAAVEHGLIDRRAVVAGDLQTVDDDGGGVRIALFAGATEPTPSAIGNLHIGESRDAFADHASTSCLLENGVAVRSCFHCAARS